MYIRFRILINSNKIPAKQRIIILSSRIKKANPIDRRPFVAKYFPPSFSRSRTRTDNNSDNQETPKKQTYHEIILILLFSESRSWKRTHETCDHPEKRIHESLKLSSIIALRFFFPESRSSFDTSSRTRHDNHNLDSRYTIATA